MDNGNWKAVERPDYNAADREDGAYAMTSR